LRKFNNWIKTLVFEEYCPKGSRVLDICGGKGGDLSKWFHAEISDFVLADIAEKSVKHAIERYNDLAKKHNKWREPKGFSPVFICANCHKRGIERQLEELGLNFDFVSCQFALHYSFECEATAKQFIKNISCKLEPGGYFVATFPSANRIVDRLNKNKVLKFGNEFYSVEFQSAIYPRFGASYTFLLKDAVDNVTEYLVHHDTLVDIARSFGLELKRKINFIDYYTENAKNPALQELEGKVRSGMTGPLDPKFWEIAAIYNLYVFQKQGERKEKKNQILNI